VREDSSRLNAYFAPLLSLQSQLRTRRCQRACPRTIISQEYLVARLQVGKRPDPIARFAFSSFLTPLPYSIG
jgi:hypothetical protein